MDDKYIQKYQITNDCMDINYKLKPMSVIMLFQDCFARYMTKRKIAAFDIIDKNLFWVVSEFNIEYSGIMPFWSEEIEIQVWVSKISRLKMFVDFELIYKNKTFTKGNSIWYILDFNSHRPVNVENILKDIPICNETTLGGYRKFQLENNLSLVSKTSYTINLGDIDFNNHVNNKSYINLAQSTINNEFKNNFSINSLSVKFYKETFLGDVLICETHKAEDKPVFVHKIKKDNEIVCDIQTKWTDKKDFTTIKDIELEVRK